MNEVFKTVMKFIKAEPSSHHTNPWFRRLGFLAVGLVDVLIGVNFFSSLGESWIMPFAGAILVFMKIWQWISANHEKKSLFKKRLHYITWFTIAVMSIIAAISFGLAISYATNSDVTKIVGLQSVKDQAITTQLQSLAVERKSIQTQIDDILVKESQLTQYDTKARTAMETQLKDVRSRADSLDAKINAFNSGTASDIAKQRVAVNAQLIFSQIFSEAGARPAIMIFFLLFGLAIELTLALSAIPAAGELEVVVEKSQKETTVDFMSELSKLQFQIEQQQKEIEARRAEAMAAPIKKPKKVYNKKIKLNQEEMTTFVANISNPPEPSEALKAIFNPPVVEEEPVMIRFAMELFENGVHPYLKTAEETSDILKISREDGNRMFKFLSELKGPTGFTLLEFRKESQAWYPNYTSEVTKHWLKELKD